MINLTGYQTLALIYESASSLVYRGLREKDNTPVILKCLKQDYPTKTELTRYKTEYELTRSLNLEGVIKAYDLLPLENSLVMILEDFGGTSLKLLFQNRPLILREFLHLARKITESIGKLHAAQIIHKDINPSNLVFNPETGQLKIIDFGISTVLTRQNPTIKNSSVLEGTLAYMSPEQTGRMNRSLDYRTDFYSLGVTFYELLTGKLPFETHDPIELVHCHLAKSPIPPDQINPEIPQVLSNIVMKLMAKTSEERYQSAWGIIADLETCLTQLETTGTITFFPLARGDSSQQFQIPQKLYGREKEIESLLAAMTRVSNPPLYPRQQGDERGVELMLIAGYSGIGKSSLVAEIYKPITRVKGYFIAGKFDLFQRNIPYSAVVSAFAELMRQFLTESKAKLDHWKEQLLAALGSNAQVIIDVIPEVELIVGKQPHVPELPPVESQNRFNLVFQNFIRVFCQPQHPLVLFLDDLQWADGATLKLMELMMTDEKTRHFLLIGAYRDNEVSPTHPFMLTLDVLRREGAFINQITLSSLTGEQLSHLVADTLHRTPEAVKPLSELLLRKTDGNPFFVGQFLKTLYSENLLTFNPELSAGMGAWEWNLEQIEAVGITDNVVELMVGKLKKLPSSTQEVLRLAACVGNSFDLNTLAVIYQQSPTATFNDLMSALQAGLILSTSKLEITGAKIIEAPLLILNFRFLHDRVQQAAYALIPEKHKKAVHLKIGQLLLASIPKSEREENIFDIVNQLNIGADLITSLVEKDELAQLNLIAAYKAKSSTAYEAVLKYSAVGLDCLGKKKWQRQYQLTLSLYLERIECDYIVGYFDQAEQLVKLVLRQANSPEDKSAVNNIRLTHYQNSARYESAIKVGLASLKMFGLELPYAPTEAASAAAFFEVKQSLGDRKIADLVDAPKLEDTQQTTIISLLMNLVPPTYLINQPLLVLGVLKMTKIALDYGNNPLAIFVYAWYGTILCGNFGDYATGYEFGSLALKLYDRFNATSLKGKLYMSFGNFISHWRKSVKNNLAIQQTAYGAAMESGDFSWCHHSALFSFWQKLPISQDLNTLTQECDRYINFAQETELTAAWALKLQKSVVLNLEGLTENELSLSSEEFDEIQALEAFKDKKYDFGINNYYFAKMFIFCLYDRHIDAYQMAVEAENTLAATNAQFQVALHYFYKSLSLFSLYPTARETDKQQYREMLQTYHHKLQIWAQNCPDNFQQMLLIFEAEKARAFGQDWQAMDLYDRAIQVAKENGFILDHYLALELAAKFWLSKGKEEFARIYLTKAHYGYQQWGATKKAEYLERKYPQLLLPTKIEKPTPSISNRLTNHTSSENSSLTLDLLTTLKASQAISGEIKLENLLTKLMKIMIKNAGASRGFLILPRFGKLIIEASASVDGEAINFLLGKTVDSSTSQDLPKTVINYVGRTRTDVVLNNAAVEGRFTTDTYIAGQKLKSLLCTPILNQGQLIAILYLENNLTIGAFTPERLQILKILSSQAAISIENALLYSEVEEKVKERTQELNEKNLRLEQTLEELTRTQVQLIQSEKMSSLGQLVAGVAHEINNPVNFIYANIAYAARYSQDLLTLLRVYQQHYPHPVSEIQELAEEIDLDFVIEDFIKIISSMKTGAERISKIVASLRNFSRMDEADMKEVSIHEGIDSTLTILENRLQVKSDRPAIKIIKDYGNLPLVECYAGQLNQVFMNLLNNAIDVLEERERDKGKGEGKQSLPSGSASPLIRIRTERYGSNQVIIRIADNGIGIPSNLQKRLFEPFFTTKPVGKGTGLGLYISYQIVTEKHGGQLECISQPGQGTEFVITIPTRQSRGAVCNISTQIGKAL